MAWLIDGMIYLGSGLMVYNIYIYIRYARRMRQMKGLGEDAGLLYVPIVLLVFFLFGYLAVGIFANPDIIVSGILLGGSVFVFLVFYLLERITDRILEHEALEAKLLAAEEGSRLKTTFLSNMSHEMRTPLNGILGMTAVVRKTPSLSEETKKHLDGIDISARHLLGMIEDALEISSTESDSVALRQEVFSLPKMTAQVNQIVRAGCEAKGLTYQAEVEGETDEFFIGDEKRLQRVLLSLLDNAQKFTPAPGNVRFSVSQTAAGDDARVLRFTVSDTGIGMDPAFLARLYDAFARADTSMTTQYGGSGLGLAVTKKLVDMMGGTIAVSSEQNVGSTFTVEVPMTAAEGEPVPEPEENDDWVLEAVAGSRILVAEDIDLNAEIVQDLLEIEGADSERAENGQIAVDMFEKNPPGYYDAILMDLRMPVMDGFSATAAIRALPRPDAAEIPIVALTANALEEDVQKSLDAGMDVHLAKPADAELLYRTLAELITRQGKTEVRK